MAEQTFRATAVTTATPAEAWTSLQRPETWEGIAGVDDVTGATHTDDGQLAAFQFAVTVGGMKYRGKASVARTIQPEFMQLDLETSELIAVIEVALGPTESGTDVSIDLTVRTRSFLTGMFFSAIADAIGRGLPAATATFTGRLKPAD
ncbi:MAG: hypothetical protein WD020_00650 [Acidimicrobiia bacterium]